MVLSVTILETTKTHVIAISFKLLVLSVTILETTKTLNYSYRVMDQFYRSQFWRLQKLNGSEHSIVSGFIGHNFGDYKNVDLPQKYIHHVLSVTILETTKTTSNRLDPKKGFYRSQFWRLQKLKWYQLMTP